MDQSLFPRTDLCLKIKWGETDKSFYCYVPQQYRWVADHYEIPYYQLETQFLASVYSYLLGIDYNRNEPCNFVKQYRPTPSYLDSLASHFKNHPLLELLLKFYQYQGIIFSIVIFVRVFLQL